MANRLTKRKKRIRNVFIYSGLIVILLIWLIQSFSNGEEVYLPGESIEGLTSNLGRDLPENHPEVRFEDMTAEAGLTFRHFNGSRTSQLPEDMGSGAAWGDYDNDSWADLYVVNFNGPVSGPHAGKPGTDPGSVLYHNNGDGSFTDVTILSKAGVSNWGNAAAWGDIDNDGWLDLVVTAYGRNRLFLNNQDGTFSDISETSGIGLVSGYWSDASWGDYNNDGYLDLYVCGYVEFTPMDTSYTSLQFDTEVPVSLNPSSFPPSKNLLFVNRGNNAFEERAEEAGIMNENGRSLCAVWCDLDDDGWVDLYVANDVSDNVLYRNNTDGTFEEISHSAFVADYRGAMGIAVGDWDRDEDFDMFITHWIAQENALFINLISQTKQMETGLSNDLKFMDEADRFGLGQSSLHLIGFGTSFLDYDNDGNLDLFIVNGSTFQQSGDPEKLIPMEDKLFWNKGDGSGFYDLSEISGSYFNSKYVGRGCATADYDNDGDMDVFVTNNGGPGILLRNNGGNGNNWIEMRLVGTSSNADAFGTTIAVVSASGKQVVQVGTQGSYLSQNSLVQHFGLGTDSKVDSLNIRWPSGKQQVFLDLEANKLHTIEE